MKKAYLTIDDAPSEFTKDKVDFLLKNNIHAIFFCIGKNLEKNPEPIIYAIKNGFFLGNHSYSHVHFSDLSVEESFQEILKCERILDETYRKAHEKRGIKLFRFPYGDKGGKNKKCVQKFLKEQGYSQPMFRDINYDYYKKYGLEKDSDVFWTFDIEDYKLELADIMLHIEEKKPKMGGSLKDLNSRDIILMHDRENRKFFKIIEELKKVVEFEDLR